MNKNLPYKRSDRVGHLIHEALAEALMRELGDPRLGGVSVVGVSLSADLSVAKVYYTFSPYSEERCKTVEKAWKSASPYLRKIISDKVILRILPELRFYYDKGIDEVERIERLLRQDKSGGAK